MKNLASWHEFIDNCSKLADNAQLESFFDIVLTPAEREKIAARYQILRELTKNELTQREIAAKLKVSIFNVTRGANQLKLIDEQSKELIYKKEK